MSENHKTQYTGEVCIVAHEHWVVLFADKRGANHIRLVSKDDAWKYDVQSGMTVLVEIRPNNRCKIRKVVNRPV